MEASDRNNRWHGPFRVRTEPILAHMDLAGTKVLSTMKHSNSTRVMDPYEGAD
jgi:hypothetical protein